MTDSALEMHRLVVSASQAQTACQDAQHRLTAPYRAQDLAGTPLLLHFQSEVQMAKPGAMFNQESLI